LEIDARLGVPAPPAERHEDGSASWSYRRTHVPPWVPEPFTPDQTEFMPWAQVGAGAGPEAIAAAMADWALLRARPTREVRALAARALAGLAAGATDLDRVRALYDAVAAEVRGNETAGASFSDTAASAVARGRGDRTVVLKAALAAAGVPAHLAIVRTFNQDPGAFRFPRSALYGYALVRAEPRGAEPVWLDLAWRRAPLGVVLPQARGQEALILPEPGEPSPAGANPVRVPERAGPGVPLDSHRIDLDLVLHEDGTAEGRASERFDGFEAASARERLAETPAAQLAQALEAALQRGFRGAELLAHAVDDPADPAAPLVLRTRFRAGWGVASPEEGNLRLPGRLWPILLGPRYLQRASRTAPLLLAQPERVTARAVILLPPGFSPRGEAFNASIDSPFGRFTARSEKHDRSFVVEESFELRMQRIAPADYAAFADFCQAVDRAQERELLLVRDAR
jgi:hypothetical protein